MLRSHVQPSCPHSSSELPCQPCHSPVPVPLPLPPPLPMPARRDCIAPTFNSHAPRTLPKYFSDLEFLFLRSCITTDSEKKYHATRFLELDEQELWECVPEFADPTASFTELTTAIFRLYPEADPERRHSRSDLDALVSELSRLPSLSRTQFADFYRSFFLISTFLIQKGRLSGFEQSFALRRAIPQSIWPQIAQRLAIKLPDVYPGDPYPLASLRDAIHFVLADSSPSTPLSSSTSKLASAAAPFISESSETLAPTLRAAVDCLVDVLAPSVCVRPSASASRPVLPSAQSLPYPATSHLNLPPALHRPLVCSYCSDPAHFIANCPLVTADVHGGLCTRNAEGKVVLPNGLFVPHRIIGPNLRARISSWHSENSAHFALDSQPPHVPAVPRPLPSLPSPSHSSRTAPDVIPVPTITPARSAPVLRSADVTSVPQLHSTSQSSLHSPQLASDPVSAPLPTQTHLSLASSFSIQSRIADLEAQLTTLHNRTLCPLQPQPSPIELCHVSEAESRFAQSQIPFGADSMFPQLCSPQNTVQHRSQCSKSSASDLSMSQPYPASHSQLQLNSFAPEISHPAHRDFTASFSLEHNSSVIPHVPDLVSGRPSSPADLILFG
ncbi:hypothetical protein MSAN_00333200 [Mycena sanguinolenta]|uniref:Uncharacterized protein n=1 Tax=Mycena sanguinolenta TaxID=230812 RepID=A0A8H7DJE1_9AGAR|nr:hypothetical protein MSAN_00333200 [Mycena sanguinolenta]